MTAQKQSKTKSGWMAKGGRSGTFVEVEGRGGARSSFVRDASGQILSKTPATLTDAEEAEIQRQIAADPDDAEVTDEQATQRMTFGEAFPDLAESIKRSRGRPAMDNPKQPISLRLSPDVIKAYKATGKGWQARMDEALRKSLGL